MYIFREKRIQCCPDKPDQPRVPRRRTVTSRLPPHILSLMMLVMTALDLPAVPLLLELLTPPLTPVAVLTMWTTEHILGDTGPSDGTLTTPSSWDPDTGGRDKPPRRKRI